MTEITLQERMMRLEKEFAELRKQFHDLAGANDWRSTVGMFAGGQVMKEIDTEGRKVREKDRSRGRRANSVRKKRASA